MTEILRCPECLSNELIRIENYFYCNHCKSKFFDNNSIFCLLEKQYNKENCAKLLVTKKSSELWTKESVWSEELMNMIPDGYGFLLDYACGGGKKRWCENKGYNYIGLDYFIDYGVNLLAHGMNIPIKDNSISVVVSNAVMEHIPDPWRGCDEIYRVLKPNGIYIGSTAFLQPYHERSHYNMTHLGVKYMLEKSGFVVENIIPFKTNGVESILRTIIGLKYMNNIIVFPFKYFIKILLLLRKIVVKTYFFVYKSNTKKRNRIEEFIKEDDLRFTSGFFYSARKI